jgi:predicted ArsR family transcriptional regulator
MEVIPLQQTLKITNVLSDPTRLSIYEYMTKFHQPVTVQDIAKQFQIHPNVARMHLSKLEDVGMLKSENKKTGKGGRPSRVYHLSNEVVELNFPFRDYQLLAKVAIEAMISLGELGKNALYETGKRYGIEIMEKQLSKQKLDKTELTKNQKFEILETTTTILGMTPDFYIKEDGNQIYLQVFNCPFREIAEKHKKETCDMHIAFIKGMIEALFEEYDLIMKENMFEDCSHCAYLIHVAD